MKEFILKNLPQLTKLAEKFKTYQNTSIDLKRIIYFLVQFENALDAELILQLLMRIDFIDSDKMTYLLSQAYGKIDQQHLRNPLICPLGSTQDSSALVCNRLIKTLFDSEAASLQYCSELSSIGNDIQKNNPSCIVLFDDNITSGTQLVQFFDELIDGQENAEIVKSKLTDEQVSILKATPIYLCFAVQLSENANANIDKIRHKYGLTLMVHVGKSDFTNYLDYGSSTFTNKVDAEKAQKLVEKISYELYKNKYWTRETIYSRLLGYGNLGKLTVFYHNVPKSLVPIFWKFGYFNHRPWIPLFPETQEAKAMGNNGVRLDTMWLETIDNWIENDGANRKPQISIGFPLNGQIVDTIEIKIPTEHALANIYRSHTNGKMVEPDDNSTEESTFPMAAFNNRSRNISLSNQERNNYLEAVKKYNSNLSNYNIAVFDYIRWKTSSARLNIYVRNNGNKSALNVTLKMPFYSSDVFLRWFGNLPMPEFKEKKPVPDEFKSGFGRIVSTPLNLGSIFPIDKPEPSNLDVTYIIKERWPRIGHNDHETVKLKLHRINSELTEYQILYEVNFDEQGETIDGSLTIRFVEDDQWEPDTELDEDVHKALEKLYSGITRESRSRRRY